MPITLTLPPEVERALLAEAMTRGISVDEFLSGILISQPHIQELLAPNTNAADDPPVGNDMTPADPEKWIQEFSAWAKGHEQENLPVLSDEAMSREFIYGERGL